MKVKAPDSFILYNGDRCGDGDEDGTECPFLNAEWRVCDEFGDSLDYADPDMNTWQRCDHCKEWTVIEERYKWASPRTFEDGSRAAQCKTCGTVYPVEILSQPNMNFDQCPACVARGCMH